MRRPTAVLLLALLPACVRPADPASAPAPLPSTDVYLVALGAEGRPEGAPRNVSGRAGYDNQPAFTADGRVLYTSIREDGQADIYGFDPSSGATTRLTRTQESEYSPTPLPGGGFSTVRVEADGTQRLWRFDAAGGDPQLLLAEVRPVGYHAWIDSTRLALFVLGEPPTLQLADTRTGQAAVVARDIGRSLHRVPGRDAISYVDRSSAEEWWITELDAATGRARRLVRLPEGGEDYAWTPDGAILTARGARLLRFTRASGRWTVVADFGAAGLDGITRLAVSADGRTLALVAAARPQ
jgi:hypothetical protein